MNSEKLQANKAIVSRFMSVITCDWSNSSKEAGLFEIRCLGEKPTPKPKRFALDAIDEAADFAIRMNGQQFNIYMTINPINIDAVIKSGKGAKDGDILRAHYSFADADDVQGIAGLDELAEIIEPDITVTTGTIPHERRHAYWRLTEPCLDLPLWKERQKQIAVQFKTDKAVVNPSRIMRVAGTVSYPSSSKATKGYVPELVTMHEGSI